MKATIDRLRRFFATRQHSYKVVFQGPHAENVLADLAWFCRANDSTFNPDARLSDVLVGRRDVWLRIANHLNLSPEELFKLSTGGQQYHINQKEDYDA